MVTITRSADGVSADIARALERVVHELLADALEPVEIQFGTWPAEDGRIQFVCRVETLPATPFGGAPQWRWWSPLVDSAEELRDALSVAVQMRRRTTGEHPAVAAGTASSRPAASAFTEGMNP